MYQLEYIVIDNLIIFIYRVTISIKIASVYLLEEAALDASFK